MSDTSVPDGAVPDGAVPEGAAGGGGSVAEQVAAAALAVPGVTSLHSGVFGEVATYLPGSRVGGVQMSDGSGEVHIVVDINHDLRAVADDVVTAASQAAGVPVSVVVEDVSVGPTSPDDTSHGDTSHGGTSHGDVIQGAVVADDATTSNNRGEQR